MKPVHVAFLVVGVVFLYGSRQPMNSQPAPAAAPRIAVVNVVSLLRNSDLALKVRKDVEELLKQPREDHARLTKDTKVWTAAVAARDFRAASQEQYEEKLIEAKRQLEDIDRKMRIQVTKKQEDGVRALWKEIEEVIRLYATQNGIQMVQAYGDAVEYQDSFANINRKLQAIDFGGCMPLYLAPGVDITDAVVELTRKRVQKDSAKKK